MILSNVYSRISQLSRFQVVLILAVLGLLAYANAINHPFVHDDVVFIQQNPHLDDLNLNNVFRQTSGVDNEFALINKYYRPLLELVNRVLYRIFGLNPSGFHLFNILLHMANSFLVYGIICFIVRSKGMALGTAVLFLLHPVQNEAVACISGISNLVFTFLCLMSFYVYLQAVHSSAGKWNQPLYGGSLLLFFLALLAKEQSVVLPGVIMAYELCFMTESFQKSLKKYGVYIGGFLAILAVYFLLRKMLFGFMLLRPMDNQGELWVRVLAIPRSLLVYLTLIFFPHDLHYYRSQDILLPFLVPLLLMLLIIPVFVLFVWRTPKPQKSWMLFGLAWFMISLGPTLNIIPLINEFSQILTAEHFLYFPLAGMILFVVGGWHYWAGEKVKSSFPVGFVIVAMISLFFIGFNVKQNTYWRGEIPLFERTLRFQKDFGRVRFLLAKAYSAEGRFEEAVVEGRKALAIMQGYEQKVQREDVKDFYRGFIKGIHYHLGYCLDILGENQEALSEFKKALSLTPDNGIVHYSVGLSYLKLGMTDQAITHFEKSLALNEEDLMVMNSLAICYQETGENVKAERLLRTIVERDSRSSSAKQNLEKFLEKKRLLEIQ